MANVNFKASSRENWSVSLADEREYPGHERIQLGCLMRIADAVEVMAKQHTDLIDENVFLKKRIAQWENENNRLRNTIRTLRGNITKIRKRQDGSSSR